MTLERKVAIVIAIILLSPTMSGGWQSRLPEATIRELVAQSADVDWHVRYLAYARLRDDSAALARSDVRRILLDLLDREDRLVESTLRESHEQFGVSERYGEEYSEYVGELAQAINLVADWNDPRQVCIMVHEIYRPDGPFAAKLAAHAAISAPCLIEMFRTSDVGLIRAKPGAVLAQIWGHTRDQIDAPTREATHEVLVKALQDSSESVRSATIRALGSFAGEDMIPHLQQVAKSDPAVDRSRNNAHWIREYAESAIAEIRKRSQTR